MRSIRSSLMIFVPVLLALGLGTVSVLVYEDSKQALTAKQQTSEELIRRRFDEDLLSRARTLASLTRSQFDSQRGRYFNLSGLGLLSSTLSPNGQYQSLLWMMEATRYSPRLHAALASTLELNEDWGPQTPNPPIREYAQLMSEWGSVWRSASLNEQTLSFDRTKFTRDQIIDWYFEDEPINAPEKVRHVILRAPLMQFRISRPQSPPRPARVLMNATWWEALALGAFAGSSVSMLVRVTDSPRIHFAFPMPLRIEGYPTSNWGRRGPSDPFAMPPPPPPSEAQNGPRSTLPLIFVHCAWDTMQRDAEIAQTYRQTEAELRDLRDRLILIDAATFIVLLIGVFLLVGWGLKPLRRLRDAVAAVSERDFRLPIDPATLPRELQPITERLIATLAQLGKAFEREKRAAADISHELRTPVAALLTTIEVTLKKARTIDYYRETMQDCRTIVQQMHLLVERLMALARLDAGTDPVRTQKVDIGELVGSCVPVLKPLAEANGLTFQVQVEPALEAETDPVKLREVVVNLVHNAIEYNKPGGKVELFGRRGADQSMVLEVRDTGIGIAPESLETIFERFYRSDPSRNDAGVHAGLGLAIVKEYVACLGGTIRVQSELGTGSTFRVELPAA